MFISIYVGLLLEKPYINFILGGLGGVLIYPIIESFLKELIED
jgi:hypothetical protein